MIPEAFRNAVGTLTGSGKSGPQSPSSRQAETPSSPAVLPREPAPAMEENRISILLVDDEPPLLELGKLFLERNPGVHITNVSSAEEGLQLLSCQPFDAVVSDYQMPGMDGIGFLREVRNRHGSLPFIIFTGRGREDVVIEALNSGADYYLQKGGKPLPLYAELHHKVKRAVQQRRAEGALKHRHAVLHAILSLSPQGIGYVRNRTFRWVNDALASMLGYNRAELRGMHLERLYENARIYEEIGTRIQQDLRNTGRSTIITRFLHRKGFAIDAEIHIAPLDSGNLHLGHVIIMADISRRVAAAAGVKAPAGLPHLELTPVIEVDEQQKITYYNEAAIDALARYGSRGTLEEFFPQDLPAILARMDEADTGSIFRDVRLGTAAYRLHITLSARFRIARLSAIRSAGA